MSFRGLYQETFQEGQRRNREKMQGSFTHSHEYVKDPKQEGFGKEQERIELFMIIFLHHSLFF